MAWRNLWRNKRRTLITTASVFFGVLISVFMSSMQEGSYAQYINTVVNSYSGYMQIQHNNYWDDKVIDNTFECDSMLISKLSGVPLITTLAPRFESFALASSLETTKGVMVMGVDAVREDAITRLQQKVKSGTYLSKGDNGVLIGSKLAKYMKLNVNGTLVLIGQGYHGVSAAGKYPVRGIIKHPSYELDRMVVFMDIATCCELFSAQGRLTSLVLMVKGDEQLEAAKMQLQPLLPPETVLIDWKKMNDMLLQQIESDRAQGVITKGVLYMIIAFGILGTIMMMMAERQKEFGVMMAIGTPKIRLMMVMVLETIFIGAVGAITGIIGSIPLLGYYLYHPIRFTGTAAEMMEDIGFEPVMYFSMEPGIFISQALTILVFTLVIGIYPVVHLSRLKVMTALHR
jgi:ABC-type lipoprotein release transport system permease subunit